MTAPRVQNGQVISILYRIENQSGEVVEEIDSPALYLHGAGNLFEKIENALDGLAVGETVRVVLSPEDAFGDYDPGLIFTDDVKNVPPHFCQIGAEVEMRNDRGESKMFTVSHIENGKITLDGNHPLAAQTITFSVTVVDIRDATPDEQKLGEPIVGDGAPPRIH